ncbi:hypothetical protein RND81_04G240500 [Saponaria officinalis]|uniref:Uncharacterized protein n=1 Tax=Saponaria officinalis TaxID=3572 RepID=A0AAW1LPA9_SAPOF
MGDDPKKVEHLRSLDGAKERLQLLPANLLEEGSFDAAVEGCGGVFYTSTTTLQILRCGMSFQKLWPKMLPGNLLKEKGIEMVTINPAMVIGPSLQPTLNTSAAAVAKLFGAETYPNASFGWVHVKDVAMAHILAFEVPSANGRYCLVESVAHFSDIVKILKELYPNATLPGKSADDKPFVPAYQVFEDKISSLGIDYIPLKVCFKEKGFVSF